MKLNHNLLTAGIGMMMLAANKGGGSGGGGRTAPDNEATKKGHETRLAEAKLRSEYVATDEQWDALDVPEFGGQSEILVLEIGEVAINILYTGHATSSIGGKDMEVHTGNTHEGSPLRLPIAASFLRALDQAKVQTGDTIAIKRFEDQQKKGGIGRGQSMQIYGIKVVQKAGEGEVG